MVFVKAFICGGFLCVIAQILIDKTNLTPARILTGYVCAGTILTALGLYKPFLSFADSGAGVPLTGFGYQLAKGALLGVREKGLLGALTGGLSATAGGIGAALLFSFLTGMIFKGKPKNL